MSLLTSLLEALADIVFSMWPNVRARVDRSVVGESRFDRETRQFWIWVTGVALIVIIGLVLWLKR